MGKPEKMSMFKFLAAYYYEEIWNYIRYIELKNASDHSLTSVLTHI